MTEAQEKLLEGVRCLVEKTLYYKETHNISPLIVTEMDLIKGFRDELLECMRELARRGEYKATRTINYPALKRK